MVLHNSIFCITFAALKQNKVLTLKINYYERKAGTILHQPYQ